MKQIRIRAMEPEDASQAAKMEQEMFSQPWSEKSFLDSISQKNTIFLVAETEEQEMIGYAGLYYLFEEGEIVKVAVQKNHRREKTGERLLSELIKAGLEQGAERFLLEVRKSNEPAICFYQKLGFIESGIRKNFYTQPQEDAVIMWKR